MLFKLILKFLQLMYNLAGGGEFVGDVVTVALEVAVAVTMQLLLMLSLCVLLLLYLPMHMQ